MINWRIPVETLQAIAEGEICAEESLLQVSEVEALRTIAEELHQIREHLDNLTSEGALKFAHLAVKLLEVER